MEAASAYQRSLDSGEKIVVGVNEFVDETEQPIETLYIDESVAEQQKEAARVLARPPGPPPRRTRRAVGAGRAAAGLCGGPERHAAARRCGQDVRDRGRDLR